MQVIHENDQSQARTVELSPQEIEDFTTFVELNRDAHEAKDPTERLQSIKDLLSLTSVKGAEVTLLDHMQSALSDDELVASSHLKGRRVMGRFDKDGELVDVGVVVPIAEDKEATKRTERIWATAPSGPKKNDTSFRTNPGRVSPR